MRSRLEFLQWTCSFTVAAAFVSALSAAETDPRPVVSAKTREQVQEALQREVYGLSTERKQLLAAAIEAEPQAAVPRWYLGQVQAADGQWKSTDKSQTAREGQLHREYVNVRISKADDAAGQKSLADWCAKNGLKQQERAHLLRSLMFNPNQSDLKARLDLVKVGNQWVERTALVREQNREKAARESYEHWMPIITKLAAQVTATDKEKRQAALEQVLAIRDPGALPALQQILGTNGEEQEMLVLKVADMLTDLSATHLIAYLAADCPSEKVRQEAAKLLKSRDREDFVPMLITGMYSPVETKVESKVLPNGNVALRRSYVREGATEFEVLVSDARFNPLMNRRPGSIDMESNAIRGVELAQTEARLSTSASDIAVSEQNRNTKARNERIAAALATATGEKLASDPELWWKWWMEFNEITLADGKGVEAKYHSYIANVYYPVPVRDKPIGRVVFKDGKVISCLDAGTPVWTEQGPVAVERVKVGDLVLSRDVETGELAYKPVLLTTVRPKRQLTKFSIDEENIQATGGHLFWVSGKGWVRARELQPSQVMHTAADPVNVAAISPGNFAETYNLVVADFHTYFVGEHKLLSHDNTPRQPTRMIVPGLAAE